MGPNDVISNLRKTLQTQAIFTSSVRKLLKTKDLVHLDTVAETLRFAEDMDALLLLWQFLLENLFPHYPSRRPQDTLMRACLIQLLGRPEIRTNTSRKVDSLTTATLQLASQLHGHPSKLEDLDDRRAETQFCTRVLAFAYLRQDIIRTQIITKVNQVTRHRDWFKRPASAVGAFPHWVPSLLPVVVQHTDVTTFDQALLQWLTVEPTATTLYDERSQGSHNLQASPLVEALVENGEVYFAFVVGLMQWCEADTLTNDQWRAAIPNYDALVTVALRLLHESAYKRQFYDFGTPKYSTLVLTRANQDAILALSGHLLKNSDLVHICILALFESTNAASAKSVGTCLDRLAAWLEQPGIDWLKSIKPSLAEFNWTVAIRLLLHVEQADVLVRTLLFLYRTMALLPWDLRHRLLRTLAQRHFALFLHWHQDVRLFYHHVLVYKICPDVHRALLDSATDNLLVRHSSLQQQQPIIDESRAMSSNASILAREMQVWRNFDGFISLVCFQERARAMEASKCHKLEVEFAQNRLEQLKHLHPLDESTPRTSVDAAELDARPSSAVEELLGVESLKKLASLALTKLMRAPPYLRHIPDEDVMHMEAVVRAACPGDPDAFYPKELQVYARLSLACYSSVLQKYYESCQEDANGGLLLNELPPAPSLDHE
ncbi:unnamed protein product [Aphanomyces euteiches]|uniref:Uncharacterized protein n=1 Tax=Aphanomyces euteiches TaxID=100861 RepID=A0A6G0WK04_9STRA|nr:hypothetical protein Ae201684_014391 [Aphanomyces euteiches]KAH9088834.1 hypothetical protein Ae201684P_013048 [Aphanomyces euteiches]KAH9158195.1 hypothetical protein AeRB84_000028 [Aphanomyces euteiches]